MSSSKDHFVRLGREPKHSNCYCEECFPYVHRWAYKMIFENYMRIAEENGDMRERIKHLEERIGELEAAIISGGAIVPDAEPQDDAR